MAPPRIKQRSKTLLRYPTDEILTKSTILRFVEYKRENPDKAAPTEGTTLIVELPVPTNISEQNRFNIRGEELGLLGNDFSGIASGISNFLTSSGSGNGDFKLASMGQWSNLSMPNLDFSEIGRALALTPGFSDTTAGKALGRYFGVIRNPHVTALFDGIELRPWNLNWKLSPRSKEDSDAIKTITDKIKQKAYAKVSDKGWALDYPDQVYVEFRGSNDYIDPIRKAFITNIHVNFGSGQGMVYYNSGAPVEIELNISLLEVDILTRNELEGEI